MDIQATLTLTIQVAVMSFVALMVFDFINSLWVVPLPPFGWQLPVIEQPSAQPKHGVVKSQYSFSNSPPLCRLLI